MLAILGIFLAFGLTLGVLGCVELAGNLLAAAWRAARAAAPRRRPTPTPRPALVPARAA